MAGSYCAAAVVWHPVPVRQLCVFFATAMALCAAGCTTARGLADEGRLAEACSAVSEAPSPLFDDDARALASRMRARLPGSVTVRRLDARALVSNPALIVVDRGLVEVVVDANVYGDVAGLVVVDAVGTAVPVAVVDEATVLAFTGAPAAPAPTLVTSTHTPGPFEEMIKAVGMVVIGVPIAIGTLGLVGPDLGGLLSTGPTTSTYAKASPELPAWQARPDVQAAAVLGAALGVGQPRCAGGRCRVVVAVAHADAFAVIRADARLEFAGCSLPDTLVVPLPRAPSTSTTTPLAALPADTAQWDRFAATSFGLDPLLDDIGDGVEDCCDGVSDIGRCCF